MNKQTRAPKQIGDFGEGLVTYALIRKGFEVAYVDHVGADLIAEKNGNRYAISVKTRLFREGSDEGHTVTIGYEHLKKLEYFSNQFGMKALFAQVISIADENEIHLFMLSVSDIQDNLLKTQNGYSLNFGKKKIEGLIQSTFLDYSCWTNEIIGKKDFD